MRDSRQAFDAFLRDTLGAVLQKHAIAPPQMTAWPVHNTLTPTGPARATG